MSNAHKLLGSWSISLLLLASAAHATPRKPTHIACVGDSITAGAGSSEPAKNYVEQLQVMLGASVDVQNFGKSGATMLSQGFGDKPYDLEPEYTAATTFVDNAPVGALVSVIINLGANDSKPQNWDQAGKPQQFKTDYLALVDHFLALKSKPVVYVAYPLATGTDPCCLIRGNIIYDEQIPLIKQVAMERRVPIIDLNTATMNHPEYFGDGVHPNDAGYLVMAQLVKTGLEREPMVSVNTPVMGATLSAGLVPITAAASGDTVDIASVEFFDGATSLSKLMAPPWTFNWQAAVGAHELTIKAVDTTLADATSEPVTVTITDAAGGVGGGGVGGTGAAGAPSGGMASAGSSSAGSGGAPLGSAGSSSGGSTSNPGAPTTETDAGCGCAVPAQRSGGAALVALALGTLLLRRRRGVGAARA